jgi:hypothetical protein
VTPARPFVQNQTHGVKASFQNISRCARRDAEGRRTGQHHGEVAAKARWGAAG